MFRFRELLVEHAEELTWLICKENGKTFAEAKGDLARGMETVEFACGIAHLSKGEGLGQVAAHIDAVATREPLGVCAGITPFNFPAMIPLWMFPLAIATGNTFVLKPSPKVPLTVNRFGELFLAVCVSFQLVSCFRLLRLQPLSALMQGMQRVKRRL